MQARVEGQNPHTHQMPYGRRSNCRRNWYGPIPFPSSVRVKWDNLIDVILLCGVGVDGVDVVIGTSSFLREFSHGKDMAYITKTAIEVINFVKSKGIEVRFSTEDSFRSDLVDLLSIYQTVDKIGVNRVGIADTVGCANPRQVYELVRTLRGVVGCDIEIHLHNDTGMAIANAYTALEAGATHIDTCEPPAFSTSSKRSTLTEMKPPAVLGIGERVGITPLGGLVACLYAANPEYVKAKYKLAMLREVENLVAEAVEVNVPFMNPITCVYPPSIKAGSLIVVRVTTAATVHLPTRLASTQKPS